MATRQDAEALEATITRIKAGLDARGVHYEDISGRPKNLYGIWCKMKASGITDIAQVYDLTALRVVVSNKHDCYAALRVLQVRKAPQLPAASSPASPPGFAHRLLG